MLISHLRKQWLNYYSLLYICLRLLILKRHVIASYFCLTHKNSSLLFKRTWKNGSNMCLYPTSYNIINFFASKVIFLPNLASLSFFRCEICSDIDITFPKMKHAFGTLRITISSCTSANFMYWKCRNINIWNKQNHEKSFRHVKELFVSFAVMQLQLASVELQIASCS